MTHSPPPLTYASTSSDEQTATCPPWIGVSWLLVLLLAAGYAAKTMSGHYESIGQPLVAWTAVPNPNAFNPRFGGNGFGNNIGANPTTSGQLGAEVVAEVVAAFCFCLLIGMIAASALWHWPRPFLWLLLVLPVATVAWYLIVPQPIPELTLNRALAMQYGNVRGPLGGSERWSAVPVAFGVQVVGISIGLVIGRPIARLLAMILLPPGVRASVAPYWTAAHRR